MAQNSDINLADAYQRLRPSATQAVLEARAGALKKISAEARKDDVRVLSLCQLAFGIPLSSVQDLGWLETIVQQKEASFTIDGVPEEAKALATIVLLNLVSQPNPKVAALILAAAFGGLRQASGDGELERAARDLLASVTKSRSLGFETRVGDVAWGDLTTSYDGLDQGVSPQTARATIEAVAQEGEAIDQQLVANMNGALASLTRENRRLAEEVDLLWWHLGGVSRLLDRPLSEVEPAALPLIVGCDVASMISVIPGPHGALGVILRALGDARGERQSLRRTLEAVDVDDRARLMKGVRDVNAVGALHLGLSVLADEGQAPALASMLKSRAGLADAVELTRGQIAIQAFYERLFVDHGWL